MSKNILKKFCFSLIIFCSLIPNAYCIGVGSFVKEIKFYPNLNENIEAFIINNVGSDIRVKIEARGSLAEYATFSEEYADIPAGGKYFFAFNLKLPEDIPPGRNRLEIGATDVTPPPPGSGIRAVTSAFKAFIIEAPYPGKYIEASFIAPDIELDEKALFEINIVSKGKEIINKLGGLIDIYNNDYKIDALRLDEAAGINPGESRTIKAEWDSRGQKVGEYKAKAFLNYDGEQSELEAGFKIGTLLVDIINYTRELYKDEINRFDIEIQGFWNAKIEGVYGEVEVGDQKIKTLETALAPWNTAVITAYLDASNLGLGAHIADITVYYADKAAEESGMIMVLPKREKIVEMPSKMPSTTALLIAIIALLVIANVILALYYLKHGKPAKKKKKGK